MNKKIIIPIIIIGIIVIIIVAINNKNSAPKTGGVGNNQNNLAENIVPTAIENNKEQAIKEFSMTSFYEIVDAQPRPQYSLKEITVKKGDLVRIKITVTKGAHDFKIDEFDVYADTIEFNKEYVVEFTADKAGEFIYYCTKPNHRQNGQWGTLKVLDN